MHLLTENGQTLSIGNGHQIAYSRAYFLFSDSIISLFGKQKIFVKFELQVCKRKNDKKNYSWHLMHMSSVISSLVFAFRKESKLVELLVYSSFRRVATNMLRTFFLFTSTSSQVSQVERK